MSTADKGQNIGRIIKYADFVRVIDADLTPEQAASIVELIETATADRWATITAQVNAATGINYEVPSAEGVLALAAVYRMRRQLPVADFDAAGLAIQIERRLARLASGEVDAADVALASRYVAAFDKALWSSRSPAKMAERLASYSAGWWWHRSKEMREKYAPRPEVVRLVIETYRNRAVLPPPRGIEYVPRTCTGYPVGTVCTSPAADKHTLCSACELKADVELLGGYMSDATRAEVRDVEHEIDREQERKQRSGGSR